MVDSYFADEVIYEKSENLKITKKLVQSEEYAKLLSYQLDYISPLICKHLMDSKEALPTDELQSIIKNYVKLVKELFDRPSSIQWRNKYIASEENKLEYKKRATDELIHNLNDLVSIKLFDDEKRAFEEKMSHYFGASKRVGRLASLKTINEFINAHGFKVNDKRQTLNDKKKTFWIIEMIESQGDK